jgi:hypothetical protein
MNMWGQPPPAVQASEARPPAGTISTFEVSSRAATRHSQPGRLSLDKTYDPARATGIRLLSTGTSR